MEKEFQLNESLVYLNHAAVSPWPARTARAVELFARENLEQGATHYLRWMQTEQELRSRLARLINAPSSEDISLLKNTSEALSTVAYGIDWQVGDNVVIFKQEFPSNRLVWESLGRFGVEARLVDLYASDSPEQTLMDACDQRTRLISTSSVQYADGFRADLDCLGRFCRRENILFCVDAIQSLGAFPFDVQRCQADFVMADGHKWMLGPEGLALFYTRKGIREQLQLNQFGWRMVAAPHEFDRPDWQPSETGTRFECGTPNMLGIHALNASLSLIEQEGIENISGRILRNTDYLIGLIDRQPALQLLSDRRGSRQSGIVTFRVEGAEQQAIYHELMNSRVICACRGGGIRFSPHFYTPESKLDAAIEKLLELIN